MCERIFKDHIFFKFVFSIFERYVEWKTHCALSFSDPQVLARGCLITLSLSPSGNKETFCLHLWMFSSLAYAFGSQPECFFQIVYDAVNSD